MLMSMYLVILATTTGSYPLMQFTATIFKDIGSILSPNNSAIIVATLQLFGSYSSVLLVDKLGRKPLLLTACIGAGISLATFGIYAFLCANGFDDVKKFNWIPIFCYSVTIFLLAMGIMSLFVGVMTEILPSNIKGIGTTISMLIIPIMNFSVCQVSFD